MRHEDEKEGGASTSTSLVPSPLGSPELPIARDSQEIDKIDEYDVAARFLAAMAGRPDGAELLAPWSPAEEARVKRKIDRIVLPILFMSTLMCGTDKVILGTAATFGLQTDLKLKGQEYAWSNSILGLGMIVMMLPQGYFAQRYNIIGKVYAANVAMFGVVLFGMSGVKNAAGLLATRFLLGMFESTSPSLGGLQIAMWWKRDEQNIRSAIIYSTFSSVVNGLLSYAMQFYNPGPLSRWRLLFVVMACWSILVGFVGLVFLPNSPMEAWWMTDREKVIAVRRVATNNTGVNSHRIKRSQLIEAVTDPKTWILFLVTVCLNLPNGGLVGFNSLIVKSLGFTIKQTTLLAMPTGVISWISALVVAHAAQRTRRPLACVIAGILVCVAAVIMLYTIPRSNVGGSLGALFLLFCFWGPDVAIGSYVTYANVAGASKKVAVYCIVQFGYCTGSLIGPQTFRQTEAPTYRTAIVTMLVGYCVSILLLVVYGFLCWRDNQRRDAAIDSERIGREDSHETQSVATEWKDLTDKQNPAFRYTW